MGDEADQFTPEELKILGEEPPTPPGGPETPPPAVGTETKPPEEKPEHKEEVPSEEEKEAAESQGYKIVTEKGKTYFVDDEGTKIPAKRFGTVYREAQEAKRTTEEVSRKLNLFKELGPDKFYDLYPDEKPEGYKPAKEITKDPTTETPALGNMTIQGGPHNGKTLNEVWQEDPAYASWIQNNYLNEQRRKVETEEQTRARRLAESNTEVQKFYEDLSKEMFNKESSKLTPTEEKKVDARVQSVMDWMEKTRRGGNILTDAYFLMNQEKILADAKTKGGKEALEALNKPSIPSVNTGGGTTVTPFDGFDGMTPDQLAEAVEKMNEMAYTKFLKEAPQSLRAKHPGLPWS